MVLADTDTGLTGTEIARLLAQVRVADPSPGITKWKRLYNALATRQNADRTGDRILAFIARAMEPARYEGQREVFEERRRRINVTLAYLGYEFGEDGKFHIRAPAETLTEAEARADRLRAQLLQRNVHPDVVAFCRAELLEDNYFHAVLEACKSVAAKTRDKNGLETDGAELVQQTLGGAAPILRISALSTDSERREQRGFTNLATGLFGAFRNPTAHEPRIRWPMSEEDALDLFCLASYVHRRIDGAAVEPRP